MTGVRAQITTGVGMSRVPYPSRDQYPQAHLAAYDRLLRERGPLHIFLALANIPNLLDPLLSFTKEMKQGAAVDARLRELAIMTVGLLTGAKYEFSHHWNSALAAGVRREQLENLADFEHSGVFDDREKAVIRYAQAATLQIEVPDPIWADLRAHFDVREAMDIVMAVAWYNAVVRMILPLQIEIEDWFEQS
jgi:alkylhydroperoxidase family enzyme